MSEQKRDRGAEFEALRTSLEDVQTAPAISKEVKERQALDDIAMTAALQTHLGSDYVVRVETKNGIVGALVTLASWSDNHPDKKMAPKIGVVQGS